MNLKDKLTEATILSLQNKLTESADFDQIYNLTDQMISDLDADANDMYDNCAIIETEDGYKEVFVWLDSNNNPYYTNTPDKDDTHYTTAQEALENCDEKYY